MSRYQNWITARWRDHLQQTCELAAPAEAEAIRGQLQLATVVEPEDILPTRVQFGCLVTVFSIDEEEEQSFQIVSYDESISGSGFLDENSPLAQALFGAREGDVVPVVIGNGSNCQYEVTHIRAPR